MLTSWIYPCKINHTFIRSDDLNWIKKKSIMSNTKVNVKILQFGCRFESKRPYYLGMLCVGLTCYHNTCPVSFSLKRPFFNSTIYLNLNYSDIFQFKQTFTFYLELYFWTYFYFLFYLYMLSFAIFFSEKTFFFNFQQIYAFSVSILNYHIILIVVFFNYLTHF